MAIVIGTVEEAVAAGRRRRFDEGHFRGEADYLFESAPGEELGPQALVARQAPGWALPVHFHMQHQFQVVLRGSGSLGPHELVPGSVHYTSPQSAYGPIVAGDDGLDYFTLRVLTDKGAWYMPEARPHMQLGLRKEQRWGTELGPEARSTLIGPRSDGLAAWLLRAAGGETLQCDMPIGEAGRFHLVLQGEFELDGRGLPGGSCVYCTPEESPRFVARAPGSVLVVVQFPGDAVRHFVPPQLRIAPSPRGTPVPTH